MNKHILELAYKAGYGTRWTSTEQFDQFMEKFAELIVMECADLCERIAKVHLEEENPIAYVYGSRQCRDTIKQNFGVEAWTNELETTNSIFWQRGWVD